MCEILENLYRKKQLLSHKVRYVTLDAFNNPIQITDVYDEYSYNDRKFIRVQVTKSSTIPFTNGEPIIEGEYKWLEVKPFIRLFDESKEEKER